MNGIDSATVLRMGWTLVHFLWQGVALAGVLVLMLWSTKGRSPRLRYGLACLVLAAMAIAPILTWYQLGQPQTVSPVVLKPSNKAVPDSRSATPAELSSLIVGDVSSSHAWEWVPPLGVGLWLLGA